MNVRKFGMGCEMRVLDESFGFFSSSVHGFFSFFESILGSERV